MPGKLGSEGGDDESLGVPPHAPLPAYYDRNDLRQTFLNQLFNRTANHYRSIDRATGFGSGVWWRKRSLREAGLSSGMRVLDVGCGPGLVTQCAIAIVGSTGRVVGLDPSTGMLREAGRAGCRDLVRAVGERLPFPDASFDFLSMGYALRHVSDLSLAFAEYLRVLRPGGIALILEISRPRSAVLLALARFYIKTVLGVAFATATGKQDMRMLMSYWWDTTEQSVSAETILAAMRDAGFGNCELKESLSGLLRDYRAAKAR
jgi:demethylmenaquinone methyltransferase / 2-methoxy-6-polyprenyl-1,4-benzoquinol methylase